VLTFSRMQNGAQNMSTVSGRLLGFVRVVVGGHVCDLAVQAVSFDSDGERMAGGFFVDDAAPPAQVQAQIEKGTAEAVRHLSKKYLN
jgi:hypothetical protein